MRNIACWSLVLGLALCGWSHAAPRASTGELPAALKAIRPSAAKVLTTSEAQQIRGQGFKNPAGNFYGYKPGGGFKNPAGNFKGYKPGRK